MEFMTNLWKKVWGEGPKSSYIIFGGTISNKVDKAETRTIKAR